MSETSENTKQIQKCLATIEEIHVEINTCKNLVLQTEENFRVLWMHAKELSQEKIERVQDQLSAALDMFQGALDKGSSRMDKIERLIRTAQKEITDDCDANHKEIKKELITQFGVEVSRLEGLIGDLSTKVDGIRTKRISSSTIAAWAAVAVVVLGSIAGFWMKTEKQSVIVDQQVELLKDLTNWKNTQDVWKAKIELKIGE